MSDPIPPVSVSWEPINEGIILQIEAPRVDRFACQMPMSAVRELREDMSEAAMLSRGMERKKILVHEIIPPRDYIEIMGGVYQTTNLLDSDLGYVVQFDLNEYFDETGCEIIVPSELPVTVWRAVE